jgi:cellulose 1,4-beta-cellobiosidase
MKKLLGFLLATAGLAAASELRFISLALNAEVRPAVVSANGVSVALTCSPPAPVAGVASPTGYNFSRGTTSGGPLTVVGSSSTCSFTDLTVNWATTYYYTVSSVNAAPPTGTCTLTSGICQSAQVPNPALAVVIPPNPVPNAPSGLSGTVSSGSVSLHWAAPTEPVAAYRIFRKRAVDPGYTRIAEGVTATTYVDKGLSSGTYDYEVKAVVIENGERVVSEPSNVLKAQVH